MNDIRPEIPSNNSKLNSALPGFGQAIRDFVAPLIRSALEGPPMPQPCTWLQSVSVGPPEVSKPGEEPTLPTPQIQLEDDSQPITDLRENHKSLSSGNGVAQSASQKKSGWPPPPPALIDAIAEGALAALSAIQQLPLDEGVIAEPILLRPVAFPEEATPQKAIGCTSSCGSRFTAKGRAHPLALTSIATLTGNSVGCRL
jgi:hypothetical protein